MNSLQSLQRALLTTVHFLEMDFSVDRLDRRLKAHSYRRRSSEVRAQSGRPMILARYPTEWSSDLSLKSFFSQLLRHNAEARGEVAGAKPGIQRRWR